MCQVVGGQEMGGRIGTSVPMALVPNISSATSALTSQVRPESSKCEYLRCFITCMKITKY